MKDLVSVVVPVYNTAPWLPECLESIQKQTYSHLEVILVDDGSTDGSAEICRAWADRDPRIRVVHQENAGPGAARNTGMELCRGQWLMFADSDDRIDAELVAECLTCIRTHGTRAVLCGLTSGDPGERPVDGSRTVFRGPEIRQELLPGLFTYQLGIGISACGKLYDAAFLKARKIRFPADRDHPCEDGRFMLDVFSAAESAAILPRRLYRYRRRTGSRSRQWLPERQERNDGFLLACEEFVRTAGLPAVTMDHIAARYHGMTLGNAMQTVSSHMGPREKRRALTQIFSSPVLCRTLTGPVLSLDAPLPRLFWICLRWRCHTLCRLLLQLNRLRQGGEVSS